MSSERHARVKELFLVVCSAPPEEREAVLDRECGGDPELRRELDELLRFHEEETGLGRAAPPMPERIGSYRILQKVGEGGMGEVYEAEQTEPVRRRVALKVIKWGMDTKEVLARFESERQALALMNHANIARVYEAGATEQGRPYFAMEYVKGVAITDYCDTHLLSTSERLELFTAVCHGVQHAHQRGVIHRDMKPSNVLITLEDDRPVPKIIDFGVAKATSQRLTERTVFTELGQWIGTPEYMSPEQAEMTGLDIDTRTDVYSLGVILYELLVGAQPFDSTTLRGASFDEMRRRIREDEPPRPSTRASSLGDDSRVAAQRRRTDLSDLVKELKGDLDWIVMKALEKDRTRRYSTPLDLAADIDHHLRNEPVAASPPSSVYRLRKFVRRNRVAVAAGSLVLIALLIGVIGTSIGLVRANREAESARQVVRFLSSMLWGMSPGDPRAHTASVEEILARGAERIDSQLADQPLVEAHLKGIIGQVYLGLGEFGEAGPLLEDALDTRRQLLGEDHPAFGDSLMAFGWYRAAGGDYRAALPLYEQAKTIYEASVGSDHRAVGDALTNICYANWRLGNYDEALATCDRALGIYERSFGPEHSSIADVLVNRAIVLREISRLDESTVDLERALEIRQRVLGPDHAAVGWVLHDLGIGYQMQGDRERARAVEERALAIQEKALGPDSHAASFPLHRLAMLARADGDVERSRALYERAVTMREEAVGPDHPDMLWILRPYGHVLRDSGEVDEARRVFERALAIAERAYGSDHLEYAVALGAYGYHLYALGRIAEARRLNERDLEIVEGRLGVGHKRTGTALYNLTCLAALEGDREAALGYFRRAIDSGWSWAGVIDDPDLDSLRGDPDFEAMLAELKARLDSG